MLKENEEAIAYGWMMLCLYFGAAVLIWLSWAYVYNEFLTVMINPDIEAGKLSLQTVNSISWNVNVFRYAPPIILLFGFIFGVNRAITKRSGGT